jgi:hypothetical protein
MIEKIYLKKIIVISISILLLLFIGTGKILAQRGSGGSFSLGIKAGLSNGQLMGKNFVEISGTRHGLNAGLYANLGVSEYLDICLEALYIRSGAIKMDPGYLYFDANQVFTDKIVNSDITTNSVNFPLLLAFTLPVLGGDVKPRVYLGGDFNLNFASSSLNTTALVRDGITYYSQTSENLGDRIKSNDFGAIAGTGFSFTQKSLSYLFDVRYRMGFANLNATSKSAFINSRFSNTIISTSFGIAYNF